MQYKAETPDSYVEQIPEERKEAFNKLRQTILANLPSGFKEEMNYGMIGYVVPHSIYPSGYHCDTKLPRPFINSASQNTFVALYHMGSYANPELLDWFATEYPKHSKTKLDMGKSCIRFKKPDQMPFELIGELAGKMTVADWISVYEANFKK